MNFTNLDTKIRELDLLLRNSNFGGKIRDGIAAAINVGAGIRKQGPWKVSATMEKPPLRGWPRFIILHPRENQHLQLLKWRPVAASPPPPSPGPIIELTNGEGSVLTVLQQVLYTDWSSSNVSPNSGVQEWKMETCGRTFRGVQLATKSPKTPSEVQRPLGNTEVQGAQEWQLVFI